MMSLSVGGYPGFSYTCGEEVVVADYDPSHAAPTLTVYTQEALVECFDRLWQIGVDDPEMNLQDCWAECDGPTVLYNFSH